MKTSLFSIAILLLFSVSSTKAQGICFLPQTNFIVGTAPVGVATGDFNTDGVKDVIIANQASNNISLFGKRKPLK